MTNWAGIVEMPPIDVTAADFRILDSDMGVSPDRSRVYVTGFEQSTSDYAIGWFDTVTNTFDNYVLIADNIAPDQLLIDPVSGDFAYTIRTTAAVSPVRNSVRKIDLSDGSISATAFPVGALPYRFSITPDGAFLIYGAARDITGGISANVWKIDTSDMSIDATITGAGAGPDLNGEAAFTADSATAVVAGVTNNVFVVDMSSFTVTNTVALPTGYIEPYQCLMTADDSTCWVAAQNNTGTLYDAAVPLDIGSLTWGTPVQLNTSTTTRDVSQLGPLRMTLSVDEAVIVFAHVADYWKAVQISDGSTLKNLSLAESVSTTIGRHGWAPLSNTKYYIMSNTSDEYVIWIEGKTLVQVMRWW